MIEQPYKNPSSNVERRILAIIEEARRGIDFGKIGIEISIRAGKITTAEIIMTKKTIKLD